MINIINYPKDQDQLKTIFNRNQFEFEGVNTVVNTILSEVKKRGDEALFEFTKKFDLADLDKLAVTPEEIEAAFNATDDTLIEDLIKARDNIQTYHEYQKASSFEYTTAEGARVGQWIKPIERVGIYVPGGTAAYPSTVLMNAIPAKIAGVKEVIMVSPPNKEGKIKDIILVAAKLCGVDQIYKLGGAQSIAALTYGTKSVPKVNKIVGPGNIYVAMAKKAVSGYVGIDMIAGPSEILILADGNANPTYIAADLMGQAEHDPLAASILVTTSKTLANKVIESLKKQIKSLERQTIIKESLLNFGAIILTETMEEAIQISNQVAPEHLEILTTDPWSIAKKIENAGAIFLGEYTPEPVGDYFAGPNHTLPTSGTAAFSSALSTTDFYKKISIIEYPKNALENAKDSIIRLADAEGLTAHANAVKVRFKATP